MGSLPNRLGPPTAVEAARECLRRGDLAVGLAVQSSVANLLGSRDWRCRLGPGSADRSVVGHVTVTASRPPTRSCPPHQPHHGGLAVLDHDTHFDRRAKSSPSKAHDPPAPNHRRIAQADRKPRQPQRDSSSSSFASASPTTSRRLSSRLLFGSWLVTSGLVMRLRPTAS